MAVQWNYLAHLFGATVNTGGTTQPIKVGFGSWILLYFSDTEGGVPLWLVYGNRSQHTAITANVQINKIWLG